MVHFSLKTNQPPPDLRASALGRQHVLGTGSWPALFQPENLHQQTCDASGGPYAICLLIDKVNNRSSEIQERKSFFSGIWRQGRKGGESFPLGAAFMAA